MIVGLTGGIGSGKSTVSKLFRSYGIAVVDADAVAREVVEPGTKGFENIVEHFGNGILLENGSLDRAAMRERIFTNPSEKQWLEHLLHPLIREQMFDQLNRLETPYKILEAPLLFENNLHTHCQKTILVDVEPELQVTRTALRDKSSNDEVNRIISSQMPRDEKLNLADYILDNSGSHDDLEPQVLRLHNVLSLLAQNPDFI